MNRLAGFRKRPRMRHRDTGVFMQFALPAVVEQTERRVALLLYFGQHDTGADGVDGAGRNVDHVPGDNGPPVDEIDDRAVLDRCAQLLGGYPMLQSSADPRIRPGREDVPRFALAIRHPHRARVGVVGVNLDRQGLAGEQQLEQQRRRRGILVRTLEPQFAYGVMGAVDTAPWLQIMTPPRLVNDPHGSMFGRHGMS